MKKMNFYLSDPHVKYLEEESRKLDINMSEIMRRVMDFHIAKEQSDRLEKDVFKVKSISEGLDKAKIADEASARKRKSQKTLKGE